MGQSFTKPQFKWLWKVKRLTGETIYIEYNPDTKSQHCEVKI